MRRVLSLILLAAVAFPLVGFAGDGLVALQTAEPACGDDSGDIYVDCENGTVTDNRTGLVWLKNANCIGPVDWPAAMDFVAGLADNRGMFLDCDLDDNSSPGDWRLPSAIEWWEMISAATSGCTSGITNDAGDGCWAEDDDSSFTSVLEEESYWSASVDPSVYPQV